MTALIMSATSLFAKKVSVTIEGTVPHYVSKIYLIVNEDTANARLLPIENGKVAAKVKVDAKAFIRISESKDWPSRNLFVLIPDSKHITFDGYNSTVTGSPMSERLHSTVKALQKMSSEGFHIDVFTDNIDEIREANKLGNQIRQEMDDKQRVAVLQAIDANADNQIPAWLAYIYKHLLGDQLVSYLRMNSPKWATHPILNRK